MTLKTVSLGDRNRWVWNWVQQRRCVKAKSKQKHESKIGKRDGREEYKRTQRVIHTHAEVNIAALRCPKNDLALTKNRRVLGVLFASAVLRCGHVDTMFAV